VTATPPLAGTVAVVALPDGAAVARRFAGAGSFVVLTGADEDEVGRLMSELETGPGRVAYFHSDLSSDGDVDALVEFVAEQVGPSRSKSGPPVS
jgi:NAD(P)-dependent dehydrogenase (short-subunit alcohol dehydrogenase family)